MKKTREVCVCWIVLLCRLVEGAVPNPVLEASHLHLRTRGSPESPRRCVDSRGSHRTAVGAHSSFRGFGVRIPVGYFLHTYRPLFRLPTSRGKAFSRAGTCVCGRAYESKGCRTSSIPQPGGLVLTPPSSEGRKVPPLRSAWRFRKSRHPTLTHHSH